jgi:hypothetical protein
MTDHQNSMFRTLPEPNHNLTPNGVKWSNFIVAHDAAGTLGEFTTAGAQALLAKPVHVTPTPAPSPAAPTPGFLYALPGGVWPGWKHSNKQHAEALPPGADRDAAFANLDHANQIWNMEGRENSAPLACYPFVDGKLDIAHPILSTTSWPSNPVKSQASGVTYDTSTDAGVLAFCNATRKPGPNPDAPPFPHPGG